MHKIGEAMARLVADALGGGSDSSAIRRPSGAKETIGMLLREDTDMDTIKDHEKSDEWNAFREALQGIPQSQPGSQNSHVPSSEDIAWVDSFLVEDLGTPDVDEDAPRDLSRKIRRSRFGVSDSPATRDDTFLDGVRVFLKDETVEKSGYEVMENGEVEISLPYGANFKNAFLPHYKDEEVKVEEEVCEGSDGEPSLENIFRVWELDVPDEEFDFVEQLNRALGERLSPAFEDDNSPVDLIAAIADISLNPAG